MVHGVIVLGSIHYWPDSKWQVIFKTALGYDYCRETLEPLMTLDDVKIWTKNQLDEYANVVNAAVIERW